MSKEPTYKVLETHGKIELREYDPFLVAEVEISGERKEAIRNGFRLLAPFIFGENQSKAKIPMHIPVTQQKLGSLWKIHFMLPKEYSEQNIPRPNSPEIKICAISAAHFAVILFSGTPSEEQLQTYTHKLEIFCQTHQLQTDGPPIFAFYNPPWTLPFLRRNEVMYKLYQA